MRTHGPKTPRTAALLLGALLGYGLAVSRADAADAPRTRPPQSDPAPLAAEVRRLETELQRARAQLQQGEAAAAREATEIEQLKAQPPGVARDLDLQRRLARAQERAEGLSQRAARLRALGAELGAARQRLMHACDQLLEGGAASLSAAQRFELLRIRSAQAEALAAAAPAPAIPTPQGDEGQPDDPQILRERADLLRDSADRVQRELARLEQRAEELQRRQRLRERALSVDEDLFAEQVTSRRANPTGDRSRLAAGDDTAAEAAPSPPPGPMAGPGGGARDPQPPTTPTPLTPTRSGLDPATQDILRRADGTTDPEGRLEVLRRAQAELRRLSSDLNRRAAALDKRSEDLRRRK